MEFVNNTNTVTKLTAVRTVSIFAARCRSMFIQPNNPAHSRCYVDHVILDHENDLASFVACGGNILLQCNVKKGLNIIETRVFVE